MTRTPDTAASPTTDRSAHRGFGQRSRRRVVAVVVVDPDGSLLQEAEGMLAQLGVNPLAQAVSLEEAVSVAGSGELDLLAVARVPVASSAMAVDLLKQIGELDPSATTVLLGFSRPPTVAETLAGAFGAHRDVRAAKKGHGRTAGRPSGSHMLTRRELEVLRLAARGHSNNEVAKMLWLSRETVKFHLSNTYRKLGVGDRRAAAETAAERGLLPAVPLVESAAPEDLRK